MGVPMSLVDLKKKSQYRMSPLVISVNIVGRF